MVSPERPDLSGLPADVVAYIEALEAELAHQRGRPETSRAAALPEEPPTPYSVITISRRGVAKRSPRHLYGRQRRSGEALGGVGAAVLSPPKSPPPAVVGGCG